MKIITVYTKSLLLITLTVILTSFINYNKASAQADNGYSAEKAISYADSCFTKQGNSYVKAPNEKYGDDLCAGYISQCLLEGGMKPNDVWYWNSRTDNSAAWRICASLFSYLKDCGYEINYSPTADDVNPGDILFYYRNGNWSHTSICTGKTDDGTPYVNAYNNPHYHYTNWTMGYKTCVVSMSSYNSGEKQLIENGVYYIKPAAKTSLALGVTKSSNENLAQLSLMSASGEQYNRKFQIEYLGNGKYSFTALHSEQTLSEIYDEITSTNIICQTNESNSSNQWTITTASSDTFYIQNCNTSNYLSISSAPKNGVTANSSDTAEDEKQMWQLTKATTSEMKVVLYQYPDTIKSSNKRLSLSGIISSNYNILSVRVKIINKSTNQTECSTSAAPKTKTYKINGLGKQLNISTLSSGNYSLKITAYDNSKKVKTLANKKFKIK